MRAIAGPTGAIAFLALSLVLAIALVASAATWRRERADLRQRVAYLTQQNERSQSVWKARLAACQASDLPRRTIQTAGPAMGDETVSRLLAQGPEGIDGCARMESADQAVLSTLK